MKTKIIQLVTAGLLVGTFAGTAIAGSAAAQHPQVTPRIGDPQPTCKSSVTVKHNTPALKSQSPYIQKLLGAGMIGGADGGGGMYSND